MGQVLEHASTKTNLAGSFYMILLVIHNASGLESIELLCFRLVSDLLYPQKQKNKNMKPSEIGFANILQ